MLLSHRIWSFLAVAALAGCGGAGRHASTPHSEATLTAASVDGAGRVEKILVADNGSVSVVERDGCMATVRNEDELHTRCAKPERMQAWFAGADKSLAKIAVEQMTKEQIRLEDDVPIDVKTPSAKMLTAGGKALRVTKATDVAKLNADVRALADELASAEQVTPGPATENGWQMLHVAGPARVMFGGTPTRGLLEARMSTNGQYLCEFTTAGTKATKSGWIKPSSAAHAIDVVLGPWAAQTGQTASDSPHPSFAAGTKSGTEQKSNPSATAAVFELFSEVQDALGDACLPELEPPTAPSSTSQSMKL